MLFLQQILAEQDLTQFHKMEEILTAINLELVTGCACCATISISLSEANVNTLIYLFFND